MNPIFDAGLQVERVCSESGWQFCFIGGVAVLRWGEPRLTQDVDLTLLTGFGREAEFVDRLLGLVNDTTFTREHQQTLRKAIHYRNKIVHGASDRSVDDELRNLLHEWRTTIRLLLEQLFPSDQK